ncbi:hypothetical protein B0H34DRAFT_801896 [Crassisporium funariophilum]|nr:hypothetical protein B0H34DRAFT_801896 [Crassisporium funariophilum]
MDTPQAENKLVSIGKGIYFSRPSKKVEISISGNLDSDTVSAPTIILIFGWMGAQLPHLQKYSKSYDQIYPEAAKIVIRCEPSFFWSSKSSKRAHLAPVVEALEILGCLPPAASPVTSRLIQEAGIESIIPYPTPRVLVHAFSNGGSWQLATLSEMLNSRNPSSKYGKTLLSPSAVILDSCPGDGGLDGTLRAFTSVIRNPISRQIARVVVRLIYLYLAFIRVLLRRKNTIDGLKATLNSERLLPWFSKNTKRLYIYSPKDDMIPYHEVEGHARQAKECGLDVSLERFEDSAHVAHAKAYPEQYWTAVKRLWEDVSRREI